MNRNAQSRVNPAEMEFLRTSLMASFKDCPRRWHAERVIQLDKGDGGANVYDIDEEEGGNAYTRRGTAVHEICEQVLLGSCDPNDIEQWEVADRWLKSAGVPEGERQHAHDYCIELRARLDDTERWRLIAVEKRFVRVMVPGAPPVKGTPDAIWYDREEEAYVIQDHKTNRRWEDEEVWRTRLQQRTYAWAIRDAFNQPAYHSRVDFEIGCVNLGMSLRWITNPADDEGLVEEYAGLWQELAVYTRTGNWPERINRWCAYCPLMRDCATAEHLIKSISEVHEGTVSLLGGRLERIQELKSAVKIGEALIDTLQEEVRAEVIAASIPNEDGSAGCDGHYREGGLIAELKPRSKRETTFTEVWSAWNATPLSDVGTAQLLASEDEVFSVRLTALDKACRKVPEVGQALAEASCVRLVAQEPTLVIRPARAADGPE